MPPGMQMERPPMPPEVQAQMGGGGKPPFGGMGDMMAEKAGAGSPLKSAVDMTEKIWTNAVKESPTMGPYVARAMAILKAGMEETANAKPGGGAGAPPPQGGGAPPPPAGPGPGNMPA